MWVSTANSIGSYETNNLNKAIWSVGSATVTFRKRTTIFRWHKVPTCFFMADKILAIKFIIENLRLELGKLNALY